MAYVVFIIESTLRPMNTPHQLSNVVANHVKHLPEKTISKSHAPARIRHCGVL